MSCTQLIGRRGTTPVLCLAAALTLGVGAWTRFSGDEPAATDQSESPSVGNRDVVGPNSSRVKLIEHELPDDQDGRVVAASGTDFTGVSDAPGADQRLRKSICGKWEDDYRGKRHLSVSDNGTGTMVVEPDGIGRALFADKLSFDIEWSIADGQVTMRMLGGEPESKVNLILKLHGREASYKILNLDDDQLLLLDKDGKTRYDWRRPVSPE